VPCSQEASALYNELSKHTYSSLDALASDAQPVVDDCNYAEAAVFPIYANRVPASPPPPPAYITAPLENSANAPAFHKLISAVEQAVGADESLASDIQVQVYTYRNVGPDFPSNARQYLLDENGPIVTAAQHAQDVLHQLEQDWHYTS